MIIIPNNGKTRRFLEVLEKVVLQEKFAITLDGRISVSDKTVEDVKKAIDCEVIKDHIDVSHLIDIIELPKAYIANDPFYNIEFPKEPIGKISISEKRVIGRHILMQYLEEEMNMDTFEIKRKYCYPRKKLVIPAMVDGSNSICATSLDPIEKNSIINRLSGAFGNVLVCGLNMGYSVFYLAQKKEVETITVVESNPDKIRFFNEVIRKHIPNSHKIKIIEKMPDSCQLTEEEKERVNRNVDTIKETLIQELQLEQLKNNTSDEKFKEQVDTLTDFLEGIKYVIINTNEMIDPIRYMRIEDLSKFDWVDVDTYTDTFEMVYPFLIGNLLHEQYNIPFSFWLGKAFITHIQRELLKKIIGNLTDYKFEDTKGFVFGIDKIAKYIITTSDDRIDNEEALRNFLSEDNIRRKLIEFATNNKLELEQIRVKAAIKKELMMACTSMTDMKNVARLFNFLENYDGKTEKPFQKKKIDNKRNPRRPY